MRNQKYNTKKIVFLILFILCNKNFMSFFMHDKSTFCHNFFLKSKLKNCFYKQNLNITLNKHFKTVYIPS